MALTANAVHLLPDSPTYRKCGPRSNQSLVLSTPRTDSPINLRVPQDEGSSQLSIFTRKANGRFLDQRTPSAFIHAETQHAAFVTEGEDTIQLVQFIDSDNGRKELAMNESVLKEVEALLKERESLIKEALGLDKEKKPDTFIALKKPTKEKPHPDAKKVNNNKKEWDWEDEEDPNSEIRSPLRAPRSPIVGTNFMEMNIERVRSWCNSHSPTALKQRAIVNTFHQQQVIQRCREIEETITLMTERKIELKSMHLEHWMFCKTRKEYIFQLHTWGTAVLAQRFAEILHLKLKASVEERELAWRKRIAGMKLSTKLYRLYKNYMKRKVERAFPRHSKQRFQMIMWLRRKQCGVAAKEREDIFLQNVRKVQEYVRGIQHRKRDQQHLLDLQFTRFETASLKAYNDQVIKDAATVLKWKRANNEIEQMIQLQQNSMSKKQISRASTQHVTPEFPESEISSKVIMQQAKNEKVQIKWQQLLEKKADLLPLTELRTEMVNCSLFQPIAPSNPKKRHELIFDFLNSKWLVHSSSMRKWRDTCEMKQREADGDFSSVLASNPKGAKLLSRLFTNQRPKIDLPPKPYTRTLALPHELLSMVKTAVEINNPHMAYLPDTVFT